MELPAEAEEEFLANATELRLKLNIREDLDVVQEPAPLRRVTRAGAETMAAEEKTVYKLKVEAEQKALQSLW